jgi:signal transduction histidine kinase/ActR/RegA family two-component response regulator
MEPVNILMVDDHPAKLLAYEAMLAGLDENLIRAASAREALTHLLRGDIAVVLMDVDMPEIDGFELAAMMREHPRCQRTAIIFVSAVHMSEMDQLRGYRSGAVDYVSVPVIPEVLRAKIAVFVDLYRKTAELNRLNEELDARVRMRTNELEVSLARLKESEAMFRRQSEMLAETDRRRTEFLAMLAHELRNPLAPIRNAVEVLRRNGDLPVGLNWVRDMVDRQVSHLVRLVDDLVDASRISRGKLVLSRKTVELTGLIAAAIDSVRSPLRDDPHELVVSLPPAPLCVEADPVRLTQVVLNLVNNAIKFTPAGGKITVSVERVGGRAEIRVRDTGRGIAPSDLAHVFEMFYQGEAGAGDRSGLGLGLTLVKTLVEMHGGTVTAQSAGVERGAEFVVVLPVVATAAAEAPAANMGSPAGPARRVLIVDDNHDAVDSLAELLRMVGHNVQTAYDGQSVVDAASHFEPDVVVLDIGMPRVDGYAAARAIRAQPWGADILLIAMTGWAQTEDKRRAAEAGFDTHLVKPVSLEALLEAFACGAREEQARRNEGSVVPFTKAAARRSQTRA